jgi:hypothetical protein
MQKLLLFTVIPKGSSWGGGMSTVLFQLNEVLDPKIVDSTAK